MAKGVKKHRLDELDIMDMRVVKLMGRYGDTAKAAQEMGVTRSMVIYRIQLVENYFQQAIYFRNTKGDNLTPFGFILAKYADEIIDLYTEMMLFGRNYKKLPVNKEPTNE